MLKSESVSRAIVLKGDSKERRDYEDGLRALGIFPPLQHKGVWIECHPNPPSWLAVLLDGTERPVGCIPLSVVKTRALPGHFFLRAERFGMSLAETNLEAALAAVRDIARKERRVLRVDLEVFSRDPAVRMKIASAAGANSFRPVEERRLYLRTPIVDLQRTDEVLLRSFDRMVRKNINKTERLGHVVRVITDVRYAPRIDALYRETMTRGGGRYTSFPWEDHIPFSARYGDLSRINGLFLEGREDLESLVAVRWCGIHGSDAQDLLAASTRVSEVPVMHAVVWDQLHWARDAGALWFDFGGVPDTDEETDGPLGGIAAFKKLFGPTIEEVGGEWCFTPRPFKAALAGRINKAAEAVRRVASRLRGPTGPSAGAGGS